MSNEAGPLHSIPIKGYSAPQLDLTVTMRSSRILMKPSFPFKLHEMLDEAEKIPALKAIVSWQPHGRAFIVHNAILFIQEANTRR